MTTETAPVPAPKTFLRIPASEWKRKAVHIGSFGAAFLLPYLTPKQAAGMAIGALLFNMFVLPRLMPSIIRREGNTGYLEILMYPAAVLLIILPATPKRYTEGYASLGQSLGWWTTPFLIWGVLALIDGVLGISYRMFSSGTKLQWNERKTLKGAAVGTVMTAIVLAALFRLVDVLLLRRYPDLHPETSRSLNWFLISIFMIVFSALLVLAESLWFGICDNLVIPVALLMVSAGANQFSPLQIFVPIAFGLATYFAKKATLGGAGLGMLFAISLMCVDRWFFAFVFGFFLLGTLATRFKSERKSEAGLAETRGGQRGAAEVFGAISVSAALAGLAVFSQLGESPATEPPDAKFLLRFLVVVSPLIAKTMDTVSSEMGKAIGGTTISLRTFKIVPPGTDGGVSFAGTLWGLAAAALLAALILPLHWGGAKEVGILVAIAVLANLFESYWTAWAGPRGVDDGPHTNFMMTLFAATLAWFYWL